MIDGISARSLRRPIHAVTVQPGNDLIVSLTTVDHLDATEHFMKDDIGAIDVAL